MPECALGCRTRDGYPYRAPEGYQVCDRCVTRLRDTLDEITERWRRIVPTRALLPVPQGLDQRRTVGYASTPPGNMHVMAMRDARTTAVDPGDVRSPLEVLHTWASAVRQWRAITAPRTATVDSEAGTLKFHLDFIVRHFPSPSLVLFAGELHEVCVQLRDVTDERRPPVVGHCTATVDGETCTAPLRLPEGGMVIRCPGCGAVYEGPALVRLYQIEQGST